MIIIIIIIGAGKDVTFVVGLTIKERKSCENCTYRASDTRETVA